MQTIKERIQQDKLEEAYRAVDILRGTPIWRSGYSCSTVSYPEQKERLLRDLAVLIAECLHWDKLQDMEPVQRRLIGNQLAILLEAAETEGKDVDEEVADVAVCAACRTLYDAIGAEYEGACASDMDRYTSLMRLWRSLAGVWPQEQSNS